MSNNTSLHRAVHTCMSNVVFSAAQAKADKVLSSDMFFFFWFPPGELSTVVHKPPEIKQDEKNAGQMQKKKAKNKQRKTKQKKKRGKVSKS